MATKTLAFTAFFVVAALAVPTAVGQSVLPVTQISILGTVFCTVNATAITATTPVFPNALVQLQCRNTTILGATTNSSGVFQMVLGPLTGVLSSILNNCKLVVNTPLAACNATLPAGVLQSALSLMGSTAQGVLGLVPTGFTMVLQ